MGTSTHTLLPTSRPPHAPPGRAATQPRVAFVPTLPQCPAAGRRMPVGLVQHPATATARPEPHVPGGSAEASRSSSSPAAALPLPSAARRLLRKDCCQEMRRWIRWIPAAGILPSPAGRAGGRGDRAGSHPRAGSRASGERGGTGRAGRSRRQRVPPHAEPANTRRQHPEGDGGDGDGSDLPQGRHGAQGSPPPSPPQSIVPRRSGKHSGYGDTGSCACRNQPGLTATSQGCVSQRQASTILPNLWLQAVVPELPRSPSLGKWVPCSDRVPLLGCAAAPSEMGLSCGFALVGQPWEKPQYN